MKKYIIDRIIKVYDGDTIRIRINLGLGVFKDEVIRFKLIDTPEMKGPDVAMAIKARNWLDKRLRKAIEDDDTVIIETKNERRCKYHRLLSDVYINGENVSEEMLGLGFKKIIK